MQNTWRTKPHQFFITPTFEEIQNAVPKNKGKLKVSFNLVQDIFNVLSFEYYDEDKKQGLKDLRSINYYKMFEDETSIRQEKLIKNQKRMDYNIQEFLVEFDFLSINGKEPLEKAVNTVLALAKLQFKKTNGSVNGTSDDILPIFTDDETESVSEELQNFLDSFKDLSDEVCQILELNKNSTKSILELNDEVSLIMEISRKLKKLAKFQTTTGIKFSPVVSAKTSKRTNMTNLGQISKVNPKVYLGMNKDYLNYKLATKSISIKEKGEFQSNKQLLYMMIDKSGSMAVKNRITVAKAILLNRLEAVAKGNAVLYFSFFDGTVSQEFKAETKEEAKDLFGKLVRNEFNGGSTNIDFAIKTAVQRIKEIKQDQNNLVKPEICIVTDGDDTVMTKKEVLDGLTLHAFLVGGTNKKLLELAEKTGGVSINWGI